MRREAARTLYTFSPKYQNLSSDQYEVIVIDNNSSESLDKKWVESISNNFKYIYYKIESKSPCKALNFGASIAKYDNLCFCIDGARMASPNILRYSQFAIKAFCNYFIYTISYHLGPDVQNKSIEKGYNDLIEDKLLDTVKWKTNGYELFNISCLAGSSSKGETHQPNESNCFFISKINYWKIGGYDERFESPGGGICNLDIFNRANSDKDLQPVLLLGEGTFHQAHGGVATNAPINIHPFASFAKEYYNIKNKNYETYYRTPFLFGKPTNERLYK